MKVQKVTTYPKLRLLRAALPQVHEVEFSVRIVLRPFLELCELVLQVVGSSGGWPLMKFRFPSWIFDVTFCIGASSRRGTRGSPSRAPQKVVRHASDGTSLPERRRLVVITFAAER